jgi:predicted porin
MQGNGVNSTAGGAISGEQFAGSVQSAFFERFNTPLTIDRQRTFGAGASYTVDAMTFGAVWTQSRLNNNAFDAANVVNNYEVNARYLVTPALALGAAYTYSQEKVTVGGASSDKFKFHQFGLQADYALSKRTDFHIEAVGQIGSASGDTAAPSASIANSNGAFGPSSSSRQVLVNTGIRHRF